MNSHPLWRCAAAGVALLALAWVPLAAQSTVYWDGDGTGTVGGGRWRKAAPAPFVTTSGGISGFNTNAFTLDTSGFTNPFTGTWSIGQSGNNLTLNYAGLSAIPEPSTYALWAGRGAGSRGLEPAEANDGRGRCHSMRGAARVGQAGFDPAAARHFVTAFVGFVTVGWAAGRPTCRMFALRLGNGSGSLSHPPP